MEKIIEIKNLSKAFGDKKVLEDINLYIRRGEFITLLGPSGCGKTTLLRMIAGFLQPDEGSILMDGKELADQTLAMQMGQEALAEIFSNGNQEQQLTELFNEP